MTSENGLKAQATEMLKAFQSSLVARDFEKWFTLFSADAVVEFPYAPAGYTQRLAGIEEIRSYMHELFMRMNVLSFSTPECLVSGDTIVAEYTCDAVMTGTEMTGTEKPYRQSYISVFHTKDGKITHFKDYWNPMVLLASAQG
ncbi:nuclear transport factor 2 family protein [Paenibacillus sp. SAF-054]|uniref:nuclear transport factor 2 family protein n=1 Tax=unclassified Paenibacillus TaxID=185978 RepID=UPI003F8132B3